MPQKCADHAGGKKEETLQGWARIPAERAETNLSEAFGSSMGVGAHRR
jgi:hypothetical protein